MLQKPNFAVIITSIILVVYCIFIVLISPIAYFIFSISPILVLWTAWSIIRFGVFRSKELTKDEEWGYNDITKEELGIF